MENIIFSLVIGVSVFLAGAILLYLGDKEEQAKNREEAISRQTQEDYDEEYDLYEEEEVYDDDYDSESSHADEERSNNVLIEENDFEEVMGNVGETEDYLEDDDEFTLRLEALRKRKEEEAKNKTKSSSHITTTSSAMENDGEEDEIMKRLRKYNKSFEE